MRELYLVYRVLADGDRRPECIMGVEHGDIKGATKALDKMVSEANPDFALGKGERWEFVPRDLAPVADWEEIAPPGSASLPY